MLKKQAMNNFILVRITPPGERVAGRHGVIIPRMKMDNVSTGTVESIGPTVRIRELREGMTVLFPPYGTGHRNTVGGVEYISLLDWELIGYFEG
jgi:co-chaperonin GroES (HSP10)